MSEYLAYITSHYHIVFFCAMPPFHLKTYIAVAKKSYKSPAICEESNCSYWLLSSPTVRGTTNNAHGTITPRLTMIAAGNVGGMLIFGKSNANAGRLSKKQVTHANPRTKPNAKTTAWKFRCKVLSQGVASRDHAYKQVARKRNSTISDIVNAMSRDAVNDLGTSPKLLFTNPPLNCHCVAWNKHQADAVKRVFNIIGLNRLLCAPSEPPLVKMPKPNESMRSTATVSISTRQLKVIDSDGLARRIENSIA